MLKRFITKGTVQVNTNESPLLLIPNLYSPLEIGCEQIFLKAERRSFYGSCIKYKKGRSCILVITRFSFPFWPNKHLHQVCNDIFTVFTIKEQFSSARASISASRISSPYASSSCLYPPSTTTILFSFLCNSGKMARFW